MELIVINDSKLKVTLTAEDMDKYSLCCEDMDYDNTETRKAFWQILDEAKHKTGFDAASDRVFIQVYPCKSGGCEMYVIKLKSMIPLKESYLGKNALMLRGKVGIYCFDCLEALMAVCKKLDELGYTRESAAYVCDDGKLYLIITEKLQNTVAKIGAVGEYSFIEEYGRRFQGTSQLAYIKEHSRLLEKENAVSLLAGLCAGENHLNKNRGD